MFSLGTSDSPVTHADPIDWKSEEPVWVDQWPLTQEKLSAAQRLVQEQLRLGHIEPSTSAWNSPIFVIKKKSGKWRLLQDLRKVNETMMHMGALQPGLPTPSAIPDKSYIIVIDLKDCFYTIPLAPQDCKRFAFSLPSVNFKEPMQRYQWRVLPQGMTNSPTLCQKFVATAIAPVRQRFPQLYLVHYMDDILLAHADEHLLYQAFSILKQHLSLNGLVIADEKIQTHFPYNYLGFSLYPRVYNTQLVKLQTDHLKTLNDFQKLLGDINWIRPYLKLPTYTLQPLFDILKGDSDPASPRTLSLEGRTALQSIEEAIRQQQITYCDYQRSWGLYILPTPRAPTGVLYQDKPLRWIYLSATPTKHLLPYYELVAKIVAKGRHEAIQYFGMEPPFICVPYALEQQDWLFQFSDNWSIAFANYPGRITHHYPSDKLLQFASSHAFIFPKIVRRQPIPEATLIFTDGSSNGTAALIINHQTYYAQTSFSSAQVVELFAVHQALLTVPTSFNLFTDSSYVVGALQMIETVPIIGTTSPEVLNLFTLIQQVLHCRQHPCFFGHIRAHSTLPGALVQGNHTADVLTKQVFFQSAIDAARKSHDLHHQNSHSLRLQFKISREAARQIVKSCSTCPQFFVLPQYGVNPRGLRPNHLWQTDVTHIPQFGRLKYVHVSIDTFSNFLMASLHTGESTRHCIQHLLFCFSTSGIPQTLKTDNGPGYTSRSFQRFCLSFQIHHKTGIPYNPQGQGIVKRAHQRLKHQLLKQKKGNELYSPSPHNALNHALYVLNFLTLDAEGNSAAQRFWGERSSCKKPLVRWKDPLTNLWYGPDPVLIWGRGHVCVFPQDAEAPRWIPERLVRAAEELPDTSNATHDTERAHE